MDILSLITPFIGVLLGFILAQLGEFFNDYRDNKRTLKKLLFNLLELNFVLNREFNFEKSINNSIEKLLEKIPNEDSEEVRNQLPIIVKLIHENFKNNFFDNEKVKNLEKNIDTTISDLSEVYPLFAYELRDQYKIKDMLTKSEDYLNQLEILSQGQLPNDFKEWIAPRITNDLMERLKKYILAIAKKISRKTYKDMLRSNLLEIEDQQNPELDKFLNEGFDRFTSNLNQVSES